MEKPKSYMYNGKPFWTGSQRDMALWVVWHHGAMRPVEIIKEMKKEFGAEVSDANLSLKLKELVKRGLLVRPVRGMYIHPKSPAAAEAIDIFS